MLSKIRDEEEKAIYVAQVEQIVKQIEFQNTLPKDAQINSIILLKLMALKNNLETEIILFDKINEFFN